MKNLERVIKKYQNVEFNIGNYSIGGGLADTKFESRRHEDAKGDFGKLTEGQACQVFKKATGRELEYVKAIINFAIPNMEWHHAGKLPKQYGGGMKKTYFVNSSQIVDLAMNWELYELKYQSKKEEEKKASDYRKDLEQRKNTFLQNNATFHSRILSRPKLFLTTNQEMNGKHGWFNSVGKDYKLTEYFSGWEFKDEESFLNYSLII